MTFKEKKDFLDFKVQEYNQPEFIVSDPISIPHLFRQKEDIEIAGFLVATIAWGNRKSILKNARRMMDLMGDSPFDYIMESDFEEEELLTFVHRTFNGNDFIYFLKSLQNIYRNHQGLEAVFTKYASLTDTQFAIFKFREIFFVLPHFKRTEKHVSNPLKNSAAKRINMFLRWMVRQDGNGVDFGIWEGISPAALSCPLDVHSGRVARNLGLLQRKQNDAKAVKELDVALRKMDSQDPVKYDFALFGLGVNEDI